MPSAKVPALELEDPDPETAQALKLAANEKTYCLRRLRFVNKKPVAVVTSHLPVRLFSGIEKQDLAKQSLYHVFENVYRRKLHWAEEVIGAVTAGEEEARILQPSPESALLSIKETTYDVQGIPIEYSVSLLRADRYTASVVSVRQDIGVEIQLHPDPRRFCASSGISSSNMTFVPWSEGGAPRPQLPDRKRGDR